MLPRQVPEIEHEIVEDSELMGSSKHIPDDLVHLQKAIL